MTRRKQQLKGENIASHKQTYRKLVDLDFEPTTKNCYTCRANYTLEKAYHDHVSEHLYGKILHESKAKGERYFSLSFCNKRFVNQVNFSITKLVKKKLFINKVLLYQPQINKVVSLCKEEFSCKDAVELYMDRSYFSFPNLNYMVVIAFSVDGKNQHEVFEEHILQLGNQPKYDNVFNFDGRTALLKDAKESKKWQQIELKKFHPPDYLIDIVRDEFQLRDERNYKLLNQYEDLCKGNPIVSISSYFKLFKFALQIEECCRIVQLLKFTIPNATFRTTINNKVILEINENIEDCPYFDRGVYVKIESMTNRRCYIANIIQIKPKEMEIEFKNNRATFNFQDDYIVYFCMYRRTFQVEHNTLHLMEKTKWEDFLFPKINDSTYVQKLYLTDYKWYNEQIKTNPEQQRAIQNIVLGTSGSAPYIIFGPPGTGKTVTIIESILQILKQCINPSVLVTAMSNAACDEIAMRLLKFIPNKHILRLYSETAVDRAEEGLWESSNICLHPGEEYEHIYPTLDTIYKFRVVIVTMTTCARLYQAKVKTDHFTHVFIDECGSSRESMSLTSIAGIVTSPKGIQARIVLSGDPKQLGPLVYSKSASKLNLNISLLERLMASDLYKKDPRTKEYNSNFITKLVRNFRSHNTIIKVSNQLFYEKEIVCNGQPEIINAAIGWSMLPNPNVPIIFHHVKGKTRRDTFSKSSFNMEELRVVISYLMELEKRPIKKFEGLHNVGLITPYRTQVKKIEEECHKRKWNIEVGTVEKFQGREKPIMIVSTVRATPTNIGFLDNPKRMNVTLTRAKCLLIVIGDMDTLKKNHEWKSFIDYCIEKTVVSQKNVII